MTRAEIDAALDALVKLGSNPPRPPGDSYLIVALARVVADQEQRLRAMEDAGGWGFRLEKAKEGVL